MLLRMYIETNSTWIPNPVTQIFSCGGMTPFWMFYSRMLSAVCFGVYNSSTVLMATCTYLTWLP
jgi:hypothetical protein